MNEKEYYNLIKPLTWSILSVKISVEKPSPVENKLVIIPKITNIINTVMYCTCVLFFITFVNLIIIAVISDVSTIGIIGNNSNIIAE